MARVAARHAAAAAVEREIDEEVYHPYGIFDAERAAIRFDDGGLFVLESLDVVDTHDAHISRLRTVAGHRIGHEFLAYHRTLISRR